MIIMKIIYINIYDIYFNLYKIFYLTLDNL